MNFTVLMTVYEKENPQCFSESLNSILVEQSVLPDQFVLVYDGPVGAQLDAVAQQYKTVFSNEFEIVALPENVGQGAASKAGFERCKYDLIARMDSDDVSCKHRFEHQLQVFENREDVDVVGGYIAEFVTTPEVPTGVRVVAEEHEQILKMFKKRNPVNNVTVMYKKAAVERIGGYSTERANEDFNLYVRLLLAGCRFYNLQETLVNVRVGDDMVERRGDINIYRAWKKNQKLLYEGGVTNFFEYQANCIGCYAFVRCPKFVKKVLYKTVFRKGE